MKRRWAKGTKNTAEVKVWASFRKNYDTYGWINTRRWTNYMNLFWSRYKDEMQANYAGWGFLETFLLLHHKNLFLDVIIIMAMILDDRTSNVECFDQTYEHGISLTNYTTQTYPPQPLEIERNWGCGLLWMKNKNRMWK
jgi:hypothetical protein